MSDAAREFEGRVVIITGAASGIGRAAAVAFAHHGARVVVADIDEAGGASTVGRIAAEGGEAVFVATDVSNARDAIRLAAAALSRWGRIDVLYNNAAATTLCNRSDRAVHALEETVWDTLQAVCLKSVYLCSKHCLPAMMERRSGSILNTTSTCAMLAEPGYDGYSAAKGAVISLTRGMAAEYGSYGIRVNALSLGVILTECQLPWYEAKPDAAAAVRALHALQRCGRPDEVAQAALFLASERASFITGAVIPVDGGFSSFKAAPPSAFR